MSGERQENGPDCAHIRVEYRNENYPLSQADADAANSGRTSTPDSPHAPATAGMTMTRGWWECASECGTRFVPDTAALRSAREDSARLRKSLAWCAEYMQDRHPDLVPLHSCEFDTNPEFGKCDFCEAWADVVVSLPQPERDDDGN